MKKIFTLFLCLIYTFVTFGGSIFVHNCGDTVLLSVYEKSSHDSCPICVKNKKSDKKASKCKHGSCNDVEVKIDQLKDKFFSSSKTEKVLIQPLILERLWVDISPIIANSIKIAPSPSTYLFYADTSPPAYILYCNIRN